MKSLKMLLAATALATLGLSGQAMAHAHLTSSAPAAEATVDTAASVTLTFSEPLTLKMSSAMVMTASGSMVDAGAPSLSSDGETMTLPLTAPLAPGRYQVMWQALSTDGHRTNGQFTFTVK